MQGISTQEHNQLIALLNPAIDLSEFSKEDLTELQAFVESRDINHDLRIALKIKISRALKPHRIVPEVSTVF